MSGVELGTIIAALLTLAGVFYASSRPSASITSLSSAVVSLGKENDRLNSEIASLNKRLVDMRTEIDDYKERMKTIADLEHDKSRLLAGITILTNQLVANGMVPLWDPLGGRPQARQQ